MKGLLEFALGLTLIFGFFFICTHIGFVPSIFFGMMVGMFMAAARDH
jgi:hypothetical protein